MKPPRIPHRNDLLTTEAVARLFEIEPSSIEKLARKGVIPFFKKDGRLLFRLGDLETNKEKIRGDLIDLILEEGVSAGHFVTDTKGKYIITEKGRAFFEAARGWR